MEDQNQNSQVSPLQDEMTEEEKKKQAEEVVSNPPVEAPAPDMPQQQ